MTAAVVGLLKQRNLLSRERNYRELVESIREVIYSADKQGRITYVSPGVESLIGYKQSEMVGRFYADWVHPEDRQRMAENIQRISAGETRSGEYRFVNRVGEAIWMRMSSYPVFMNGRFTGINGIATNITDRKRAEQALQELYNELEIRVQERTAELLRANGSLREEIMERQRMENALKNSEERFRKIVDHMPVMLKAFDEEGKILFWNKECERVTGYMGDEIIGNPHALHFFYPDDGYRRYVLDTIERAKGDYKNLDFELTCKDGHTRIVSWSSIASRFLIPGWASWGIGIDITKRKRAQDALQKSENKFRTLFNHASDAIFILDFEGRFLEVNDESCERLRYSREEFLKMTIQEITPPQDWSLIKARIEKILRMEHAVYESKHIAKGGRVIPVEVSVRTFEFKGRTAILSLCRDITVRKRLEEERIKIEEQFRQAQKMEAIGQLAGGVAHDFNNLLHVISGYTQMAMVGLSTEDKNFHYLEKVQAAAERSANLTRQLLTFSRRQALNPKYLNLNQVVNQFITMLRRIIGEDIEVRLRLENQIQTLHADPGMMEQILMNLCVNARDAMPNGGQLTIDTRNDELSEGFCSSNPWARPGQFVRLTVMDTGSGINPGIIPRIFEPFFTTKEQGKGTGLGLSTVYGCVQQHNGFIHVTNNPDCGANFSIYLPSVDKNVESLSSPLDVQSLGGTETILLAEDEMMVRDLAVQILQESGYAVLVARDGEEALRIYETNSESIDLVILDIIMPKMRGRDVYERIFEKTKDVKVLFSSGYSSEIISLSISQPHRLPLIQKPYSPTLLLRRVREILDHPSSAKVELTCK